MKGKNIPAVVITAGLLAALGGIALAAQDRFTLSVPGGLPFSDFRGYDTWQDVAVSQTEHGIKVIAANDAMIDAYKAGIPSNGKAFPDGSKSERVVAKKEPRVPLCRDGARHPEIGLAYRERFQ